MVSAEAIKGRGYLREAGRQYLEMAGMRKSVLDTMSDIVIEMKDENRRTGGPSMREIELVELLCEERPREQEAAVRALENAARSSARIAGLYKEAQSQMSGFNKRSGRMLRFTDAIARAMSADEADTLDRSSELGAGKPKKSRSNPTGKKFPFTAMTYSMIAALLFNYIVLVFDARAVRGAGIILTIYGLLGRTDALVEGIDVPKPIHYMHELEARLKLRILLMALRPVAVMVMSDRGDEVIRSAKGMAGRIGVPLIIRNRRRLVRITGVDLWQ